MVLFTLSELLDVIILCFMMGLIFFRFFANYNTFNKHSHFYQKSGFNKSDFIFSICLFVPAIVLHELGHKFVAMGFGYEATFHSPISIQHILNPFLIFSDFFALLMVIAIVSSFLGGSFLFFVPAYVSFSAAATPFQTVLIAFAGPAVNLILWLVPKWMVNQGKVKHKYVPFAIITSKINMFLFAFNMIPIPGFDGSKVLFGIIKWLF
ncbi:MAG: hypothetical protein AABW88_01400 [Nanoarchaeota archaeon]